MLLRDHIYLAIRRSIMTCEFQPGQELREQILAKRYQVSRSPIRDSLLRLEQDNLVTVLPRQGYRVNPISIQDVQDIFGMRIVIESACAAGAALADDEAVGSLDRFRSYSHEGSDLSSFADYNRAFHAAIVHISGNARMAAAANGLVEHLDRLAMFSLQFYQLKHLPSKIRDHNAIIDAIQAHNSDGASRLSQKHAKRGQAFLMEALEQALHNAGMADQDLLPA